MPQPRDDQWGIRDLPSNHCSTSEEESQSWEVDQGTRGPTQNCEYKLIRIWYRWQFNAGSSSLLRIHDWGPRKPRQTRCELTRNLQAIAILLKQVASSQISKLCKFQPVIELCRRDMEQMHHFEQQFRKSLKC